MSKKQRTIFKLVSPLLAGGLLVAVLMFKDTPVAKAHIVPSPCDFTTGGGFVITDNGNHANFGLVGGCKNGGFFGHVNFVDHDTTGIYAGLHVSSDTIDAYFEPFPGSTTEGPPNQRDICGTADTNNPLAPTVKFRARTQDNNDPNPGGRGVDKFGLKITPTSGPFTGTPFVVVTTRVLAGGDIELHKPNPSTTGPSTPPGEIAACGSDDSGLGT
jgi:hypothetical protein